MYIARTNIKGRSCFSIRKSCLENGIFISRELMDIGVDPRIFVHYPHGRSFYVDEVIENTLKSMGEAVDYDNLERMFWPFVRPDVKRRYEGACSRAGKKNNIFDVSAVHIFDKRRLSYLRTGGMNQRHIGVAPDILFKTLTEKSRDEIEQRFMVDENKLPAKEIKAYVFVIFDLQRHFNTLFAREMPQALDQDTVANHLVDDICMLNSDKVFWAGMAMENSLHAYLIRYLIMFFDTEYQKPRFLEDMEFARMHRRRYYRQTERSKDQVYAEAATVFGVSYPELKSMSKRQLQRLYRKKARELHPDHGGSHEQFIEFSKLYEEIISAMV